MRRQSFGLPSKPTSTTSNEKVLLAPPFAFLDMMLLGDRACLLPAIDSPSAEVADIKSNNERLTKINKDLDTMVVTTKMRFNMRSPTRATVITYPNRKKSRRSCKNGKLKKPVRTKKGGKRRCKKRKYTKRKRSRRRSRK